MGILLATRRGSKGGADVSLYYGDTSGVGWDSHYHNRDFGPQVVRGMSVATMLNRAGLTADAVRRISERNRKRAYGMDSIPWGVEDDSESEMEEGRDLESAINENREPYASDVAVAEDLRYHGA